jgi:hypothetical protein
MEKSRDMKIRCDNVQSIRFSKRIRAWQVAIPLSFLLFTGLRAQSENIRFERVSIEHGLSQSCVQCILQDSSGFMWFGTENGLNRYDGYGFKVYWYELGNPNSLSHNFIRDIVEDRNHAKNFYGENRLIGFLDEMDKGHMSAKEIKEEIIGNVKRFSGTTPQFDEMAIVVVKIAE